jgi:hypothetical protein
LKSLLNEIVNQESSSVHIQASRLSQLKRYKSPFELIVAQDSEGKWKVAEIYTRYRVIASASSFCGLFIVYFWHREEKSAAKSFEPQKRSAEQIEGRAQTMIFNQMTKFAPVQSNRANSYYGKALSFRNYAKEVIVQLENKRQSELMRKIDSAIESSRYQ